MKIYRVAHELFDYDEYDGFVIVADSKQEALNIANDKAKGNIFKFSIEHIAEVDTKKKGIVLSSFCAG